MNDTELDAMLKTWEAPEPSPGLREGVRQGVPHGPRKLSYRWLAAAASIVVTAGLIILAMPGSGHAQLADGTQGNAIQSFFDGFSQTVHERHLRFAIWLNSVFAHGTRPRLYVEGVLARTAPESFGEGAGAFFYLPDQGIYVMDAHPPARSSLRPAGTVKGATIEFQWEGKTYRIVTTKTMTTEERPVYVLHYADFRRLR